MRFFSILLLSFCVSSVSYGSKSEIDMRAGCLLSAIVYADNLVPSLTILRKFFSEAQAGYLHEDYSTEKSLRKNALGWAALRKEIADSLSKNKFKPNRGKDLALFVAKQWGMALWRRKGYNSSITLFADPTLMTSGGKFLYPKQFGIVDSAYQCGQLFEELVRMYWHDRNIASIMVSIVKALEKQNRRRKK